LKTSYNLISQPYVQVKGSAFPV